MRIVSYNILDGGQGRADPLAEILEAQKPDIVALVEADQIDVLDRISRRLGMDYIRGEGNSTHAVAVMSRWPIIETINHAPLLGENGPRCLLEAMIVQPGGREWRIGVAHLRPYAFEADESEREREAEAMLEAFRPLRETHVPHILCGDFNSNSPIQRIDPQKTSPKTRLAFEQNGEQIPRRVVQKVLDAGYIDALPVAVGEAAATAVSFTTQYPGQRVDYFFLHEIAPGMVKSAWIEQDRLARYASDHFPIGMEVA